MLTYEMVSCRNGLRGSALGATSFSQAVGETDSRLETVADWKVPMREGMIHYLNEGRVRGVLLWNVWEQVDAARRLIAEPGPFDAQKLKGRLPV